MGTKSPADAIVGPQSQGTGIQKEDDVIDAAWDALLSGHQQGQHRLGGLGFSNVDTGNNQVDIDKGACFIEDTSSSTVRERGSGGNPQIHSTSSASYDTEIPINQPYLVILPSAIVDLDLDSNTVNDIYISVDPLAQNSVTIHGTSGGAPSDPHVKIGTVDSSSGATTREDGFDNPSPTYDTLTISNSIVDGSGTSHSGTLADDGDAQPPESHGDSAHSPAYIDDGDGTKRQIWVIANGASDPAGAAAEDIILEEES